VDEMARFPGCEDLENAEERSNCAQSKMFEFIYSNLMYPKADRDNNIEGLGIIQFVVGIDGGLSELNVVRAPSTTIKAELMRVATAMAALPDKWVPAYKEGKPVAFQLTLPVRFVLQDDKQKSEKPGVELPATQPEVTTIVSPNPAQENIQVYVFDGAHTLKVFDASGMLVISKQISTESTRGHTVDISSLVPGQYVVQVSSDHQVTSTAFSKVKG
jgi:hypothetical protein